MEEFKKSHLSLTDKYYDDVVKPLLPKIEHGGSFGFGQSGPNSIEISPNPVNGSLNGSQYEYKKFPLIFIHYTKLKWVKDILRSGKMRMYSLSSMDDEKELSYPLQKIIPEKSDFTIDKYKEETFVLSMNEFQNGKELNQNWLEYGDNGSGAGIVFHFPKTNMQKWFHHYLSKVHYGSTELEALKQYHIHHTDFLISNNTNIVGQVKHFMLPLAAFHKRKGYIQENEVRLLVTKDYMVNENIYSVLEDGDRNYIELELNSKSFQELSNRVFKNDKDSIEWSKESYPIPVIQKIVLGPKCSETAKIKTELQTLAKEGLGYALEVVKSKLKLQ